MSEAIAFDTDIAEGWYDDPATPNMERFWTGSEWTDHVRYTDKVRARTASMEASPVALALVETPSSEFTSSWLSTETVERPQLTIAAAPTFDTAPVPTVAVPLAPVFAASVFAAEPINTAPVFTAAPAFTAAPIFTAAPTLPSAWTAPADPTKGFDDFYVPMRTYQQVANANGLAKRSRGNAGVLWISILAVVGVATGVALWVLLPR